jgi:hypothetical protein
MAENSSHGRDFGPVDFVESAGLLIEQLGLPRMAGRVLGRLLICEPPEQSAADLAAALSASAGSISGTTRLLAGFGLIERCSIAGDRRDYFRIRANVWWDLMRDKMRFIHDMQALMMRGLEFTESPAVRNRLEETSDFYRFMQEVVEDGIRRWEEERKGRSQ